MRLQWDTEVLDGILTKALVKGQRVECTSRTVASKLRYALINRVRRKRRDSADFTRIPFTVAVTDRVVTVALQEDTSAVIISITSLPTAEEGEEGRDTQDNNRSV